MAVTDQQKLDFLLKKIGYTKTKTGSVVGTGAISGTPKQPFAEAIPSPLIIANGALWNEADSIPATPPGADTTQVKVYLAATSGLRMTADATSSGQRAYIAYSTYGNTSSTRLTNWIDTQFGASYIIKVYKGDPNSGGVNLSAAGSGANDGWFFDYSAGVLNFNDTSVPSGVTDTNIYIVGYRYIGQTGAPTSGISTFSFLDLTVERNFDVGIQGGISTFRNNIDLNADLDVDGHTNLDNVSISGIATAGILTATTLRGLNTKVYNVLEVDGPSWFDGGAEFGPRTFNKGYASIDTLGIASFSGLYVSGGISTFISNINADGDLDVDGHTNLDNVSISGVTTGTTINATTFVGNGDFVELDVDGHTNLDNISVAGVSTFTGDATFAGNVSIGGTLTYEDVTNVDSVGLLTARSGIRVTGGVIEALAGENKIPSLYANMAALPSASTYHGMFAHVHATGRGYFAHGGAWYELVNADLTGRVGTGTESYFIDRLVSTSTTATSLNVTGVTTAVTVDINGDLDVDGHTNLDNVSVAGVTTFAGDLYIAENIIHTGDTDTKISFPSNDTIKLETGSNYITHDDSKTVFKNNIRCGDYVAHRNTDSLGIKLFNGGTGNNNTRVGLGAEDNGTSTNHTTFNVYRQGSAVERVNIDNFGNLNAKQAFTVAGISTLSGNVDINADIDVDGHTNLDNVSIAGVTTAVGTLRVGTGHTFHDNGNAQIAGIATVYNQLNIPRYYGSGVPTGQYLSIGADEMVMYQRWNGSTSTIEFRNHSAFFGHTSNAHAKTLTIQGGSYTRFKYIQSNGGSGTYVLFDKASSGTGADGFVQLYGSYNNKVLSTHLNLVKILNDLDVDGHTELDNVNIVGVTTAAGHVLPSADVTYDLGSSSKQWRNLYADNIVSAPGNGFIGPDLTVRNFKATGISTFDGTARFNGRIAVNDGTTGSNGQYLKSVGTGVTWATFPTLRTRDTIVASAGQTSFTFNYTVNFIDVFVNGIKLTDSEFTATNGTDVVLAVGCFVGDIVEFVSYNTVSAGGGGGGGTLNNIVEDTSPQLGGNLDLFLKTITGTGGINITGVVTATTFIGDGSGLTGITASGTGVVIKNNDNTVGTAGTINFGDDLSVTPIVAGIVTVGIDTSQINLNKLNVSGISTFNGNVDINADLDVDGHTNLDNVSVAGVTTSSGGFVGDITGAATRLTLTNQSGDTSCNVLFAQSATGNQLPHTNSNLTFNATTGALSATSFVASGDLDVDGHTDLDNVSIAGVVTATTFKGALEATSASFSSNIDANGDLDVDGHTNLDNLSVAGVSTFGGQINGTVLNLSSNITASGSISAVGANLDNQIIINGTQPKILFVDSNANPDYELRADGGVFQIIDSTAPATRFKIVGNDAVVGTGITLNGGDGHATYTGIVTALKFVGDGSSLTNVSAAGINTTNVRADTLVVGENTTGVSTFHRVNIPTNKSMFFGNTNQASISYPTSGYMYLYGGIEGDMVIQTGGNRAIKMEASGNFEIDTGSNEIAIKATKDGPVELYQNGYGAPDGLRFATTGVGVTVIGITSMTDNLMVGTAATITPAGAAQFAGIVTASSFIGDGSGLTGITASGSGVVVKDSGSTVGTAGTINFANGLDVTPISAGIVTVSTATTSISVGTSKAFINNNSSASGDGSFEIFLSDSTYSGVGRTAFRLYSPAANSNSVEFFGENTALYSSLKLKAIYGGNTTQSIQFQTNNSSFSGLISHSTAAGQFNFYNTYNGTQYNPLSVGTNYIYTKANINPTTDNTYDLGYSAGGTNLWWRSLRAHNVNAGVATVTDDVHVGAGVSAVGIVTADQGVRVNADSSQPSGNSATNYISVGESQDLKLYHNGNQNYITAADGTLLIQADNIMLVSDDTAGRSLYQDNANSRLELGFDGTAAAYVSSSNVQFAKPITASTDSQHDIGTNSVRFRNAYVDTYYGDGSNLTGISAAAPTTSDIQVTYEITNQTSFSYFRFAGNGVDSSANNPDIYLERGKKYRFINNSGGSHPFQIQTTAGSAYSTGVTNNSASSGNIDFAIRWDAPSQLKYQCTSHGSMVGNIYISGGEAGRRTTANAATSSIANNAAGNITIVAAKTYALLKIQTSAAAWVTLYTDSTSRSNDSSRTETTDPTPGSGVIAEVITTGASTQIMTPGIIGWNNDGTVSSNVYAKVVNKSGSTGAITVTLHYLEMEI